MPWLCLTDFSNTDGGCSNYVELPQQNTKFREMSPKYQKVAASDHHVLTNQLCLVERLSIHVLLKTFMQGAIQKMALNDLFSNTILMKNDLSEQK